MPAPYPVELRERVVAIYKRGNSSYEDVADVFQLGRATISRYLSA